MARRIEWEVVEPTVTCGARRGKRGTVACEMPPGHESWHCGRGQRGQWITWAAGVLTKDSDTQ